MASNTPYHDCDLCRPIVDKITNSYLQNVQDGISHPPSIDLGSLDDILDASKTCQFNDFMLRLHDQVRPSFALSPTRGMPNCYSTKSRTSRIRAWLDMEDTLKTPYGKCQVWSNHIDFLYRAKDEDPPVKVPTKWRAMFRILADDIDYIQRDDAHNLVDLGRLLDPSSACDPKFWRECWNTCRNQHDATCANPNAHKVTSLLPRSMRVIDLEDQMIKPLPQGGEYAVMSYVWGITNFLKLTTLNFAQLTTKGSLLDIPKPKTIYDAMIVAQSLGIRYLWIDALCIIQDNNEDKMDQVHLMGEIYMNAVLTIVGARAGHADGGLWTSEHRTQIIGQGGGLRWLSAAPMLQNAANLSAWSQRAWTYQEAAFSSRTLIFTEHQAYFTCKSSAWAEDYVRRVHNGHQELEYRKDYDLTSSTIEGLTSYPSSWSSLMHQYTHRKLTFESDVLIASAGVVASYLQKHNDFALCGLPLTILFEYGLLWMPAASLVRRMRPKPSDSYMFPSWSWAGWSGAIEYDRSDRDFRPLADGARVIKDWKFSYDDEKSFLTRSQLLDKLDLDGSGHRHRVPGSVSLPTVQQGILSFRTDLVRLRVDNKHWNQFMNSQDEKCEYTGYYKLFAGKLWVGSVHLDHHRAKKLLSHSQEVIVLSSTAGQRPIMVTSWPRVEELNQYNELIVPSENQNLPRFPLCDPDLIADGDNEMYNIMVVTKKSHEGSGRYRAGVGQVHRRSFEKMNPSRRDIWLQ